MSGKREKKDSKAAEEFFEALVAVGVRSKASTATWRVKKTKYHGWDMLVVVSAPGAEKSDVLGAAADMIYGDDDGG